jgi:glucokinase
MRRDLLIAGLDVGGTKTCAVALSVPADAVAGTPVIVGGSMVAGLRRSTRVGGPGQVTGGIAETVADLAGAAGIGTAGFAALGVGIPGLVDGDAGSVRHAVNLGLGDEPLALAERLGGLVGGPVVIDNDVNVAAVGAAWALGCPGDLGYLSVGTGVAAGFVLGGRLRRGAHGAAGEIGHLPVDPGGPLCECGQRGCLEAVASGTAIARRWPASEGATSAATALFTAAAGGDRRAVELRDEVAGHLAGAVALIAQTVDPRVVVLGGGVAEGGHALLAAVVDALRARARRSPMLTALDLAGRVALVPQDVPVGAVGAALMAHSCLAADSAPQRSVGGSNGRV